MSTPPSVPHNACTAPSLPTGASTADDAAARAAAAVEQCCALLSGKDDTQKFTGLLLLTKHVPVPSTDTPEGAALRSRLLEAMGTKFLKRLLKMGARARKRAAATVGTASGATTAASGAGDDGPMYEGLALGVMALFCADKALAPGLAALLPLVLASIRSQDAVLQLGETPKLQAVRDAAACVSGILHAKCRIPVSGCSVCTVPSDLSSLCQTSASPQPPKSWLQYRVACECASLLPWRSHVPRLTNLLRPPTAATPAWRVSLLRLHLPPQPTRWQSKAAWNSCTASPKCSGMAQTRARRSLSRVAPSLRPASGLHTRMYPRPRSSRSRSGKPLCRGLPMAAVSTVRLC